MDTKLRLKIGPHEFEAEGSDEAVSGYLKVWLDKLADVQDPAPPAVPSPPSPVVKVPRTATMDLPPGPSEIADDDTSSARDLPPAPPADAISDGLPKESLARLVIFDEKRSVYRLRMLPVGDEATGDAVLLLLYGALRLRGEDEIGATRLMSALLFSGMGVNRIDREAATYLRRRLIVRSGKGKGGRYRLTSTGHMRAVVVAMGLLELMPS